MQLLEVRVTRMSVTTILGSMSATVLPVLFLAVSSTAIAGTDEDLRFEANLNGAQEVPSVDTDTTGKVEVRFDEGLGSAKFRLKVRNGVAVTQAHLHCARARRNGPVVVFVFGFVPGGFNVDGELAEFTLTDANIAAVGADCIPTTGFSANTIADLAEAMSEGNIYVDVHTVDSPYGEIRGQLKVD